MDGTVTAADALRMQFDAQRGAFSFEHAPSVAERREKLERLAGLIRAWRERIVEAIGQDYGARSANETLFAEIATTIGNIDDLKKHLGRWAAPQKFRKPLSTIPGRTYVRYEPKGVVGVISPWNYPFQLAVVPAATALAAGNRVMIKPSEFTPRTADLLRDMFAEGFAEDEVSVVTGGPEVGEAFSRLPFDHLFYTGSTKVGRLVAIEAAKNLTPVTLELGGKSPCIMMPDAEPEKHSRLVAFGKWYNAGQTCVAPDYMLVPRGKAEAYAAALLDEVEGFYSDPARDPDYTAIISERHHERLTALIAEAEGGGATLRRAPADEAALKESRKLAPTLVLNPPADCALMREEIFGPVLPIVEYDSVEDAVGYVTARDHPLALYVFGNNVEACEAVIAKTTSGGAAVNASVLQVGVEHLPFGGVGKSGYGAYHGEAGFREFSHARSVLVFPQAGFLQKLITPPYGKAFRYLANKTIGK